MTGTDASPVMQVPTNTCLDLRGHGTVSAKAKTWYSAGDDVYPRTAWCRECWYAHMSHDVVVVSCWRLGRSGCESRQQVVLTAFRTGQFDVCVLRECSATTILAFCLQLSASRSQRFDHQTRHVYRIRRENASDLCLQSFGSRNQNAS